MKKCHVESNPNNRLFLLGTQIAVFRYLVRKKKKPLIRKHNAWTFFSFGLFNLNICPSVTTTQEIPARSTSAAQAPVRRCREETEQKQLLNVSLNPLQNWNHLPGQRVPAQGSGEWQLLPSAGQAVPQTHGD